MLPFGVTIPATVPQRSEIPEGLINYPVINSKSLNAETFVSLTSKIIQLYTEWEESHKI